jgi:hypothetical protein
MKKRLRQVQLEMTKLRARQAEVSKEVQNAPISGGWLLHTIHKIFLFFVLQ